jgi:hypothetical protein
MAAAELARNQSLWRFSRRREAIAPAARKTPRKCQHRCHGLLVAILRRITQRYADFAEVAYMGLKMVDSVLFDPTGGVTPPIVYAQIM